MLTRHCAALWCCLLTTHVCSQPLAELPPPPATEPAAAWGDTSQGPGAVLPHRGLLPNPPTSAAATRNATLPTVAIREFRSSVGEVTPRGATDMFIAALVKTRKFRVLERSRLAEGAATEKALNQQGMTTGEAGKSLYLGATYLFEATISEASAGDRKNTFTLGVAGAAASQGFNADSLAIDVRLTDVESGVVVDAVTVRKDIQSVETRVAGVTAALAGLFTKGRGAALAEALAPTDQTTSLRRDSVDRSLREAIEEAIQTIAKRMPQP